MGEKLVTLTVTEEELTDLITAISVRASHMHVLADEVSCREIDRGRRTALRSIAARYGRLAEKLFAKEREK